MLKLRPLHKRLTALGLGDAWEIIRAQKAMIDRLEKMHWMDKEDIDKAAFLAHITGERMVELLDKGTESVDEWEREQ